MVTFSAAERHRPLAGTKLYCLVTEAHGCEQLAQSRYQRLYNGQESNLRSVDHESDTLTTTLPSHAYTTTLNTYNYWFLSNHQFFCSCCSQGQVLPATTNFYSSRYIPNIAKRSIWDECKKKYILRTDRWPTDLAFGPYWGNFKWPYLRKGSSDPLHVWLYGGVFEVGGSNGVISGFAISIQDGRSAAIFENSNGDISAADRPIYSVFGSRMGFSALADRMALFPVSPNSRWKIQMAISHRWIIRFTPWLVLGWGFQGQRIEWR